MASDPKAEVEISAHSKNLQANLKKAREQFAAFGKDIQKDLSKLGLGKEPKKKGGLFAGMGGAAASLAGNLGAMGISAGVGFITEQARAVLGYEEKLTRLKVATGKSDAEMRQFHNSIRATSDSVGISADQILEGAQAYVALTGDMDGATASAKTWSRVAQATGSSVNDIAQTAAALKQQMGIGPEDMEATFSALAIQGKAGAIELKDLASQMSTIAPQWAQFAGGRGVQGVKELGASLQIVKKGFGGDAGETITGLQSLLSSFVGHADRLKKKGGIDVFTTDPKTGKKEMKGVLEIVDAIANSKLAKNPTMLVKALGRTEAYRAYLQLRDNREELTKLVDVSSDAGAIQRDLDTYQKSSSGQLAVAWANVKNEIRAAMTPERIQAFTDAIKSAAQSVGSIVDGLAKVGGFLGSLMNVGKSIRGSLEEDDEAQNIKAARDDVAAGQMQRRRMIESGDYSEWDNTEKFISRRSQDLNHLESFRDARKSITSAEVGEKSSAASIKAAYAAKYNTMNAGAYVGSYDAGNRYLTNAGEKDPVEQVLRSLNTMTQDARGKTAIAGLKGKLAASAPRSGGALGYVESAAGAASQEQLGARAIEKLGDRIVAALSNAQDLKVDGNTIATATKNARGNASRPAR